MKSMLARIIASAVLFVAFFPQAFAAALVDAEWLKKNLAREDVVILDTSGTRKHAEKHIPGAISIDPYANGMFKFATTAELERRFQSLGIDPARTLVIYDGGADWMATWLYAELHYRGFPLEKMHVLDGGMAKWETSGGAVTKDPSAAPKPGTFKVGAPRESERVLFNEFFTGSGDPTRYALVDSLEAEYYYGGAKFFDRAGHVPNAISMPISDLFNADKTFKSPAELKRMAAHIGISPSQQVLAHCGGGGAATATYFALKFLAGYPNARVYAESQREWLQDDRDLAFWSYAQPHLLRDAAWLNTWNGRMLRAFGMGKLSVIDVRSAADYAANHVPFSVSIPASVFRENLADPAKMAAVLAAAGVNPQNEAVIVSGANGVNADAALAFAVLDRLGQKKVSILRSSVDDYGLKGFTLTKAPTVVGAPKSPADFAVPPATYNVPAGVKLVESGASGTKFAAVAGDLVGADGAPKAANEIWKVLSKRGVSRYASVVAQGGTVGDAAVAYFTLKLMGYPDVKMGSDPI